MLGLRSSFIASAFLAALLMAPPVWAGSLPDAAQAGDSAAVQKLLASGTDVNARQADGMTALHWAVYRDDAGLAVALLEAGADATVENRYGVTPLSLACVNGNAAIVKALLEHGVDPDTAMPGGETALMTAARTGKCEAVRVLIESGANLDARERKGQTALMWAAAEGHLEVVDALLEAGADYTTPLDSGFTPFFFAVRAGHIPVAERLLRAGIDVNATMERERGGSKAPRKGTSALLLAIENGHLELAVKLLEAGADPNDQRTGFAPLHTLTWVRKADTGEDHGAPEPEITGRINTLDFVRMLADFGADVNLQLERGGGGGAKLHDKGATPFLLAAKRADVPYMKLLLELGADPFIPNAEGSTALMAAAGLGSLAPPEEAGTEPEAIEAVKLLLELGADIDAVDENGETAMHGAAYKSFPAVVKLLAERGADIEVWNQPNKFGWTPLSIALGYRPGNFRPSEVTSVALKEVMVAAGVEPTAPKVKPPKQY